MNLVLQNYKNQFLRLYYNSFRFSITLNDIVFADCNPNKRYYIFAISRVHFKYHE